MKIFPLNLPSLSALELLEYEKLATDYSRSCLHLQHPQEISNTTSIAIAATDNDKPVGLLLASFIPSLRTTEVHSIFVEEPFRHSGIGTQLVIHLEQELHRQKCKNVHFHYPQEEVCTPYLEKILKKQNWSGPRYLKVSLRFLESTFDPPWLRIEYKYPPHFKEFLWKKLLKEDRYSIQNLENQGAIPPFVSPFNDEKTIELENSLGLRYKGEMVGWMITHRTSPDTIRYTSLFIIKKFEKIGPAIKLLSDSILLQKQAKVTWGVFELNFEQSPMSWIKFVKRRLIPYADVVKYTRKCWKELKQESGARSQESGDASRSTNFK
jgi:GNAT superfamily N-acetyltransferase